MSSNRKRKFLLVAGARPNFVKIAPIMRELRKHPGVEPILVHTGQHYDPAMSKVFFDQLRIPAPNVNLEVGSGSIAFQVAEIIRRVDPLLVEHQPDLVVVVGDVNSTVACALAAAHRQVPVAHVEAGLRSFDRSMPEEVNRVMTDTVAEYLFASEPSAVKNLEHEGARRERIHFVGNVMIDTLRDFLPQAREQELLQRLGLDRNGTASRPYALATLHRASNVDETDKLRALLATLGEIAERVPLIFPVHPRTQKHISAMGIAGNFGALEKIADRGMYFCDPLGYLEFLGLMAGATMVLTDSGGIQEETTALQVPCLTLRENTERPVTIDIGTNVLVGLAPERILTEADRVLSGKAKRGQVPELWDGKAAQRIVKILTPD